MADRRWVQGDDVVGLRLLGEFNANFVQFGLQALHALAHAGRVAGSCDDQVE
ncbi:MAG: hypothetical protein ACTHLA_01735 [Asticcacaulis sp.]|uniref:hypothetical protein n=1 Tax=Asticcacaulis sp. TaxID=1872648 RepID=UPI003F7C5F73